LPNLELEQDPKLSWALRNRDFFPLDVNTAPREALLRVPGLGVRNVTRIVQARRHRKLRMTDLQRLRVPLKRARPFIVTADDCNGPRILDCSRLTSAVAQPRQLELFDASVTARTGEL
jgi:predicted DNA-binding helix-hairpin-helix protein